MKGDADIVIAGGGPVGLMLACELRLGGADPVVLERLPEISEIPKGNGLVGTAPPARAIAPHRRADRGLRHPLPGTRQQRTAAPAARNARARPPAAPAAALLIRPDGHVAWATDPGTSEPAAGLSRALRTWLSPRA